MNHILNALSDKDIPHTSPRVKVSIVGSLRDREVACSASDRQGSNFESCVWRTVSSQSSHHPQEVLLAQFSLYVHKGGLKPDSFHFISFTPHIPHTTCIDTHHPGAYPNVYYPPVGTIKNLLTFLGTIFVFWYNSWHVRSIHRCVLYPAKYST